MQISRYKLYLYVFMPTFWLACCWGFVADELIPPLHKLDTVKFLIVDFTLAILGLLCLKNKFDIAVFVSFLILSVFSSFVFNHVGLVIYFNGFRDFIGLTLAVPVLRYFFTSEHAADFKRLFDKTLYVWLWLQAVCITWQFIRYGAGDMGGGTLGEGGSGMTSMMIYVVSFYLIAPHWDSSHYWESLKKNKVYIFLLYPTFLNETKISFILFFAYFLLLMKFDKTLLIRMVYIVPLGFIMLIGIFAAYLSATDQEAEKYFLSDTYADYLYGLDLDELIDIAYKVQDGYYDMEKATEWGLDIPRFAKIALVIPILASDNQGILFGEGIGQFKGWTTGRMTPFAKEYKWLLNGSRPMLFVIFLQLGVMGIAWIFWFLVKICIGGYSSYKLGKQIKCLIAICFLLIMVYNDSLRENCVCVIFFFILLSINKKYSLTTSDTD